MNGVDRWGNALSRAECVQRGAGREWAASSILFSSRRRHTTSLCAWSSDVCSSPIPMRHLVFGKNSLLSRWTTDTLPRTRPKNRWSSLQKPSLDRGGHVGSIGRPAMPASKTPTHAPLRSLDQRMDALKRANDVRVRRAKLKKDLKDGRVRIETILGNPPEYVSTAKVIDILMAVPKFGRVKAARFLNTCRISQSKTVGGLSDRQRTELIDLFNSR